jgi:hypothetical protein
VDDAPTVRLAVVGGGGGLNEVTKRALEDPTLRLAWFHDIPAIDTALEHRADNVPALLVSFYYLADFLTQRKDYVYRDWVMDSGAFTAKQMRVEIDRARYIETCQRLLATDPKLVEVYSLDVIGDWRASVRNVEAMWAAGVPAIPCYHVGDPEPLLKDLVRDYGKVALGGAVGYKNKRAWAQQCFARVWPAKLHGFGFGEDRDILALPWHSVDATNWELGPCQFGRWRSFGAALSVRGSNQNLRPEIERYLRVEQQARRRWAKEMAQLATLDAPTVRLVIGSSPRPLPPPRA